MTDLEELEDLESFARFCDEVELYERLRGVSRMTGVLGRLASQGYQIMGRRLFGLFERQRKSVLEKVRGLFWGRTGTATQLVPGVASVFDQEEAEIDTKAVAYHVLEQLVINGSHVELDTAVGARIRRLARLSHNTEILRQKLPVKVRHGIDQGLAETMAMPYWSDLAKETADKLKEQLSEAVQGGENLDQVSARIRSVMGKDISKVRAERIARSESTSALNAGLQVSRDYLADLGLVVAKVWEAVDPKQTTSHPTRDSHAAAHGQIVDPKAPFLVGGHICRYPGDPTLPAGERINCRCIARSLKKPV